MIKIYLILFFFVLGNCKLIQVVSLFRHGARNHLNSYYDGNSTKPFWGQLTTVGMRQHQNLGKLLRKDYIEGLSFLSNTFKQGQIQVYTTDVNRTFQSARSQLYGLYGLGQGEQLLNNTQKYNIPPYDINSDSQQSKYSLPDGHLPIPILVNSSIIMLDCSLYDQRVQQNVNKQIQTYRQMNITYFPFLKRMANLFNIQLSAMNFSKISSLYDTLTVDRFLGRPFPSGDFLQRDYYNLQHLHWWYNNFKISFNLSRALNTDKLKRVLRDFDDRGINMENKKLKWTFLSAHDTDVSAMSVDLNFTSSRCVQDIYRYGTTSALNCEPAQQYATNIIFELHLQQNQLRVKIRKDGKYMFLCERRQTYCSYIEWRQRVQKNILIDINEVCYSNKKSKQKTGRFQSSIQ